MTQNRPQRRGDAEPFVHASADRLELMPINPEQMDVVRHPLAPPRTPNGAGLSAPTKPSC